MAYIFELAAECAENQRAAEEIAGFFNESTITLSNRAKLSVVSSVSQSQLNWWCTVEPEGVSLTGQIPRVATIALRVEVIKALYDRLRMCRGFRIALVGWEPASQLDVREIREIIDGKTNLSEVPIGLVVSDEVWKQIGCPSEMTNFAEGSRWKAPDEADFHKMARLFDSDT